MVMLIQILRPLSAQSSVTINEIVGEPSHHIWDNIGRLHPMDQETLILYVYFSITL
jgi:hypothetical protein